MINMLLDHKTILYIFSKFLPFLYGSPARLFITFCILELVYTMSQSITFQDISISSCITFSIVALSHFYIREFICTSLPSAGIHKNDDLSDLSSSEYLLHKRLHVWQSNIWLWHYIISNNKSTNNVQLVEFNSLL